MDDAFFVPDGPDTFLATELGRGPWDRDSLHGGPPAALLARTIERTGAIDEAIVARITVEILRPVPLGRLEVGARVIRPGRNVELLEGELSDADGPILSARAWRIRTVDLPDEAVVADDPPPDPPEGGVEATFFSVPWGVGYHTSIDRVSVAGAPGFDVMGPATIWIRARHPLLPDEALTPLGRVLLAADSGNGVSASLDKDRWLFINPDLTVHLHRYPVDEWVCLDARTASTGQGVGLAWSGLADRSGYLGRSLQSLLIRPH